MITFLIVIYDVIFHLHPPSFNFLIQAAGSTDIVPADLIEDPDKTGMSPLKKTLMALTAVGVVVSIVWFKKPLWKGFIKTS